MNIFDLPKIFRTKKGKKKGKKTYAEKDILLYEPFIQYETMVLNVKPFFLGGAIFCIFFIALIYRLNF